MMLNIANLLEPVRCATRILSFEKARIADVVPTFSAVMDAISSIDVPISESGLKKALTSTIYSPLSRLMNCELSALTRRGPGTSTVPPNLFVVASYLNPRNRAAMNMFLKYSERLLARETDDIFIE